MEQPEAFLKYVQKRYPVVSMLASQQAITPGIGGGSGGGGSSGTGGNPWKKKQEERRSSLCGRT